jgi:sugar phosphate isomerase/epimerase
MYTNDGSSRPPSLRCYFNLLALNGLPSREDWLAEIKAAGYDGVQFVQPLTPDQAQACQRLSLGRAGGGRINHPAEASALVQRLAGEGMECATVHVGWGLEDDAEAARLIEATLEAATHHRLPIYFETHRATIFQDMWRTVQFVRQFPHIRFNIDISHWYTGQEMVYGGFENKLAFIEPVLERAAFIHGRIGNPGRMQVHLDDGDEVLHPYIAHFSAVWTRAFLGFLKQAVPGDYICFTPELLAAGIYYAHPEEDASRWQQSLLLRDIALRCFKKARDSSR